jgi:competence protein ComEC
VNWKRWVVIIFILSLFWIWQQWPDNRLHVVFCDVGQGDGAVVILGSFQLVVDVGAYEDKMTKCLSEHIPFWDRKIEVVTLSHSDKDHVGALPGLKKRFEIEKLITTAKKNDAIRYGKLYFEILKGSDLSIESVSGSGTPSNEASIVVRMEYGSFSVLFTGDIGSESELALVDSGLLERIDVLKVAHHGSKYSSAKEFLEALRPKMAVISSGAKNTYGHPNGDVLIRLEMVETKILRTDKMGTVEIVSDGKTSEIRREK